MDSTPSGAIVKLCERDFSFLNVWKVASESGSACADAVEVVQLDTCGDTGKRASRIEEFVAGIGAAAPGVGADVGLAGTDAALVGSDGSSVGVDAPLEASGAQSVGSGSSVGSEEQSVGSGSQSVGSNEQSEGSGASVGLTGSDEGLAVILKLAAPLAEFNAPPVGLGGATALIASVAELNGIIEQVGAARVIVGTSEMARRTELKNNMVSESRDRSQTRSK